MTHSPTEPAPGAGYEPAAQITITTAEQLKAISDPLRISILESISREALTVKQIAKRLGQPTTKLYYHMAELEKAGFVTQVDTRVKSGIIEKYYRITAENITIDKNLLKTSGGAGDVMPDLMAVVFDSTIKEISRSIASGLVNLEDIEEGASRGLILMHSMFHLPSEKLAIFTEKFKTLLEELEAEGGAPGADTVSYGLTIAFYPRVSVEQEAEE